MIFSAKRKHGSCSQTDLCTKRNMNTKCQWEENFCFCSWKGKMYENKQHRRDSYSSSSSDSVWLSVCLSKPQYLSQHSADRRVCVHICVLIMAAQMEKHLSLWNKRFTAQPLFPFQATLTPSLCVWRENIFSFFPSLTLTHSHMLGGERVPNYIQTFCNKGENFPPLATVSCLNSLTSLGRWSEGRVLSIFQNSIWIWHTRWKLHYGGPSASMWRTRPIRLGIYSGEVHVRNVYQVQLRVMMVFWWEQLHFFLIFVHFKKNQHQVLGCSRDA